MALPKAIVQIENEFAPVAGVIQIIVNISIAKADNTLISGIAFAPYDGSENINQLNKSVTDAVIAWATSQGVTIGASDILMADLRKGQN